MNLTLTDLLTTAQIEQAHSDLADIMLSIDNEESEAITRIHVMYAERRRAARREAILKVLQGETVAVDVTPVEEAPEETEEAPEVIEPATQIEQAPVKAYTQRELAEAMGIHPSSISNIKKDGLLPEPLPGTGGSPHNPYLYEIPDIAALAAKVEERRINGLKTAGEKLEAYKAGKAMGSTPEPKEVTPEPLRKADLPTLLSRGKVSYPKGFFVGYHKSTLALDVFEMPRPLGLPAGWAVCAVVEFVPSDTKLQMPSRWTCYIPTTIGVMRETAEAIKDLVMGEKKAGGA